MTCSMTSLRGAHRPRPLVLLLDVSGSDLASQLPPTDLEVLTCSSIEQVVRQLPASRPDAILLVDHGAAFADLSRLRDARGGEAVPVLVATSTADVPGVQRLFDAGADDLCALPMAGLLLQRRLVGLVQARRARSVHDCVTSDLARAQRVAGIVQWRFDPEARTFRWSHEPTAHFAGLEGEGSLHGMLLRWVHAEDRARVEASFANPTAQPLEYRLVLPGGQERLVTQEAEAELDEASGRVCFVGVARDVTDLREAERQVDRLAYYDELTSLPNRAHASRFLKAALASAKRRKRTVTVMVLGLDRFRRINERFGHATGNAVLKEVTSRLVQARDEQTEHGRQSPFIARLGADEFAVILGDAGPDDAPSTLFGKYSDRLSGPYRVASSELAFSVSAGFASYPSDGMNVEMLLMHANSALHAAKEKGRNAFVVFDADVKKRLDRKLDVENRLRLALASETSLELHYQPKVEVPSGRVRSVEALLRWTAETGGPISPFELVSVAEETGLIHPLGDWTLRTACKQAKAWNEVGPLPIRVAVNISARQFGAIDFVEKLEGILHETALPANLLELEITEGVMMADAEAASRVLERVKQLGLRISLDDFGTGFSSLAYLTRFPIDTLKIDRSFVIGIGVTKKSETIISAIMALSRSLDIDVVAEGVETEGQRQFLEQQGPLEIQGWLFSKALPPDVAARWIEERTRMSISFGSSSHSSPPRSLRSQSAAAE